MPTNPLPDRSVLDELRAAVEDYDAKLAVWNDDQYSGLRIGYGAAKQRVIDAARELAASDESGQS